jgi:hypothetical protein
MRCLVSVMLLVIKHTYAKPSCMTTAATSARLATSHALLTRSADTESQPGFASVKGLAEAPQVSVFVLLY